MKLFATALIAGLAAASSQANGRRQYGTTGHFGNKYGHGGSDDHDHQDHIYGYDSVPVQRKLVGGDVPGVDPTTPAGKNAAKATSAATAVTAANTARVSYLSDVLSRKVQRLTEINQQVTREITAPFNYQIDLLEKEKDDITIALSEAILDANDARDDMFNRLERLFQDKQASLDSEIRQIIDAIERSEVDQKDACNVLFALRLEVLQEVTCDRTATPVSEFVGDASTWDMYEGLFDDFHYDIGHGKGTGEGSIDNGPVRDGFSGQRPARGPVGDVETDIGARTRTFEAPLYSR